MRCLQQAQHDFPASPLALGRDELVEGLLPFRSLVGVAVERSLRVRILIVDGHVKPFFDGQGVPRTGARALQGEHRRVWSCACLYGRPRPSLASPASGGSGRGGLARSAETMDAALAP